RAGAPVMLLPSPLGELEAVTQRQFLEAARSPLPDHQGHIAEALRTVWRDYGALAPDPAETRSCLQQLAGMRQMTEAYLAAYTMAHRGGPATRPSTAGAAVLAPA